MGLLRIVLLAVVLAALLPGGAQAASPGLNIMNGSDLGTLDDSGMLRDTGARWARHFVSWNELEPAKGSLATSRLDQYALTFDREAAVGASSMVVVTRSPAWASGSGDPNTPPRRASDYADFVRALARRWKGKVEVYEIWNEQDEGQFWAGGPEPARYAELLRAAYAAIKAEDPAAKVAFGPTTGNNYEFLEAAYEAGAGGSFDAVSVHTDTACLDRGPGNFYRENGRIARFSFLGYREVHATMAKRGDGAKPIYMSELGWASTGSLVCSRGRWAGQKPAGVSEADQARHLAEAYHCLAEDPYVEIAIWFLNKDLGTANEELNRYGLKRFDGSLKPAYAAFKDVTAGRDAVSGPCADFGGPKVEVLSPKPGQRAFDRLLVHATSPDADLARLSYYVDGTRVENFGTSPLLRNWMGVRRLGFGAHTLRVEAVDRSGNATQVEVPFQRVDPRTLPAQATRFSALKLGGGGRVRTVRGRLRAPGLEIAPLGKVRSVWQHRRGGRWRTVHGSLRNAGQTFGFSQRLKVAGRWRVRVQYAGAKPFRRAATPWKGFRVR
ncbi:MAG: hypothetical protein M3P39_07360 [Actinomycetota bacterium]|nr:hypothetical protein [Actinomycetota bacterium]